MRQRLVERVEVVPDSLDLAAVDDFVPEPQENVLYLAPGSASVDAAALAAAVCRAA